MFMLMFFGLLYAALSMWPRRCGHGVLALDLEGTVVEQPSQAEWSDSRARRTTTNIASATWSRRSTHAQDDDRVKAVALDLDGSLAAASGDRRPLGRGAPLRASGKPVIAYADRLHRR